MEWVIESVFNYYAVDDKIQILPGVVLKAWWSTVETSSGEWFITGPTLKLIIGK